MLLGLINSVLRFFGLPQLVAVGIAEEPPNVREI